MEQQIQWYPGHMVKAKKIIREHVKLVDLVVEVVDARIPTASRNPDLLSIIQTKPIVMVLNKADLADDKSTRRWIEHYDTSGLPSIATNASIKSGVKQLIKWLLRQLEPIKAKQQLKGRINYRPKVMVVGIPNVGKSSLINALGGKASAKTGNKPGVTRGQQWIRLDKFDLLDVPGVLWPKFECKEVGLKLAVTGAIGDHVFQVEEVVMWLLNYLKDSYPANLMERYKIDSDLKQVAADEVLDIIGRKRGCIITGGIVDKLKVAEIVLKEYREGKLGALTLEQIQLP